MKKWIGEASPFWSILGKLSLLVGVALGLIQIYKWLNPTEEYKVVAYYDFENCNTIRLFNEMLDTLETRISIDSLKSLLPVQKNKLENIETAFKIKNYFDRNLKTAFPDILRSTWRGWYEWRFKIKNKGNKEVKDMRLLFPGKGYYRMRNWDGTERKSAFNMSIDLGSVLPANEIEVILWSESDTPSYILYKRGIKITHPNGVIPIEYTEMDEWSLGTRTLIELSSG